MVRKIKKAKEVSKNVVKNTRHKKFVDVSFNKKIMRHDTKLIQSKLHKSGSCDLSL